VKLVETGEETMTGGRPKRVAEYIGDDTFCLTYADYVSDVDIAQPVPFHREQAVLATLTAIEPRGALEPSPRGGRNEDHDVPRKATGRRRLDQRGLLPRRAAGVGLHRRDFDRVGTGAARAAGAGGEPWPPPSTVVIGRTWIRCATRRSSRVSGSRASRAGRCGDPASLATRLLARGR
jgi:hypothetical protein